MRRGTGLSAATAALVAAAVLGAPAAAHAAECGLGDLGVWLGICPRDPSPSPTPQPTEPGGTLLPGILNPGTPAIPGLPTEPAPTPAPTAQPDPGAPVFTADPPVLSGTGLRLEGLSDIAIVEVPHADGSTGRALRISADAVVVDGFALDVPGDGGGLDNHSTRMTATGHVVVYADSITGILRSNVEVVIDTLSAPPSPETLSELTSIHIPLVGMIADRVVHTQSHQQTYDGDR